MSEKILKVLIVPQNDKKDITFTCPKCSEIGQIKNFKEKIVQYKCQCGLQIIIGFGAKGELAGVIFKKLRDNFGKEVAKIAISYLNDERYIGWNCLNCGEINLKEGFKGRILQDFCWKCKFPIKIVF